MATWGAHIRIAENILKTKNVFLHKDFIIGNLGPDCNKANETWTEFEPPAHITHWKSVDNRIDAENFYQTHLKDRFYSDEKYSYLIGYYSHLLTDIEWGNIIKEKKNYFDKMKLSYDFMDEVKEDWYDQDHLYFRDNPESSLFTILKEINDFGEHLEYFPQNSTLEKLRYIVGFYDTEYDHLDREYRYLTRNEMDHYVNMISDKVIMKLIENDILV